MGGVQKKLQKKLKPVMKKLQKKQKPDMAEKKKRLVKAAGRTLNAANWFNFWFENFPFALLMHIHLTCFSLFSVASILAAQCSLAPVGVLHHGTAADARCTRPCGCPFMFLASLL